jgi:hypothetical protein
MYYHTNGGNYSACHGTSGSPYPYGWFRPKQTKLISTGLIERTATRGDKLQDYFINPKQIEVQV